MHYALHAERRKWRHPHHRRRLEDEPASITTNAELCLYLRLRSSSDRKLRTKEGKLSFDAIASVMNLHSSLQTLERWRRQGRALCRDQHRLACQTLLDSGAHVDSLPIDPEASLPIEALSVDELLRPKNPFVLKAFEASLQQQRDADTGQAHANAWAIMDSLPVRHAPAPGIHYTLQYRGVTPLTHIETLTFVL